MKITAVLILTLFISLNSFSQTGKLVVIVKDIQGQLGGRLLTAIFTNDNFPKSGKQTMGATNEITGNEMQVVFDNLPAGTYGVASFQDVDMNRKLNTNFFGYPIEPFGFSRAAKINFGPPDFEDAKIEIQPNQTVTIIITLK